MRVLSPKPAKGHPISLPFQFRHRRRLRYILLCSLILGSFWVLITSLQSIRANRGLDTMDGAQKVALNLPSMLRGDVGNYSIGCLIDWEAPCDAETAESIFQSLNDIQKAETCDLIMKHLRLTNGLRRTYTAEMMRGERSHLHHCFRQVNESHFLMFGREKHVVSMSLFRHPRDLNFTGFIIPYKPRTLKAYITGIMHNMAIMHNVLPGWILRVYVGDNVSKVEIDALKAVFCEVIIVPHETLEFVFSMTWRFRVADDVDVARLWFATLIRG